MKITEASPFAAEAWRKLGNVPSLPAVTWLRRVETLQVKGGGVKTFLEVG